MAFRRITKLPNYNLRVPIMADIEVVRDDFGGKIYYANAKRDTSIDLCGQGYTPAEALRDMAQIIDEEFRFLTSTSTNGRLSNNSRKLSEKIRHYILSERKAA